MKVFKAFLIITGISCLILSFFLNDNQLIYLLRAFGFLSLGIIHFLVSDGNKTKKVLHLIQGVSLISIAIIILCFKDMSILGLKAIPMVIYFISRGYELFFAGE
jgi:hypothetical protein